MKTFRSRTPQMDCLLCKINKATKKNSHIIPGFLGESMLGNQNPRKAYILNPSKLYIRPRSDQDTPKQDFILCPSCEKYFELLETYFANNLYNKLWDNKYSHEFDIIEMGEIKWRTYKDFEPIIFHLFIYSIIWRSSISSNGNFVSFKLKSELEEALRVILLNSKVDRKTELIASIDKVRKKFTFYQIILATAEFFRDKTENFFWAFPFNENYNYYWLIFNEFSLQFFPYNGTNNSNIVRIGFYKPDLWDKTFKMPMVVIDLKEMLEKAKETGEVPWLLRKENFGKF